MPRQLEHRIRRLAPEVWLSEMRPRLGLELVVSQDAEGRDHVLSKVLVLVIAPDDDEVRLEVVEYLAGLADLVDDTRSMGLAHATALVRAPFLAQPLRPAIRGAQVLRQARVLQRSLERGRPCSGRA